MSMPEELRNAQLLSTREAAAAFIEDMHHLREVVNRFNPSRGEIRRLSGILRRLLIERDIAIVASPRIGRIEFSAPDNKPVYRAERYGPYPLFISCGASLFGTSFRALTFDRRSAPRKIENFDPERTVLLRLDNLLSQKVICSEGQWASRGDVIKYVANVAHGVHSGTPKGKDEDIHKMLAVMRRRTILSTDGKSFQIRVDLTKSAAETAFSYRPDDIDIVLVEILAAIQCLVSSADVQRLEADIKKEIGVI
jgi:hypothetical protein